MEEMKFDQEEMRRLAGRYFAGEIAAEEERELFRFVTSDAACRRQFAAWRLEWEAMPASDAATDRDWRRLRSRIRLQGSARSARPGRFAAVWRAAAAVAVVCATFFGARLYDRLLLERATERYTVTTKSGDRSTVCLPDGTQVRLNGSSTLTYPANFNATNRSVELSGAAYFDVSPDEKHRFEVKVGNCSVVVKGTKFDVTAYPDDSLITPRPTATGAACGRVSACKGPRGAPVRGGSLRYGVPRLPWRWCARPSSARGSTTACCWSAPRSATP